MFLSSEQVGLVN